MSGRAVIVVSARVLEELSERDLRLVLTHEIAHIKRRDHWFRWLEWVALVTFWWNPVVWWARQQLRISEEKACDELVLQQPTSEINQYANSLLNVAELLATSAIRPPVLATATNSSGSLEKRLKTMMNGKATTVPTLIRATIVAVASCALPLGLVYAQDLDAVERRLGGGVEAGELTLKQAALMLDTLQRATAQKHEHAKRKEQPSKKVNAHLHSQMIKEINAAAKAGKLSKEEAERKMQFALRNLFEAQEHEQRERAEQSRQGINAYLHSQMIKEINAAAKAGKLSKEEAERKMQLALRNLSDSQKHEHALRRQEPIQESKARELNLMAPKTKAAAEAETRQAKQTEQALDAARRSIAETRAQMLRERKVDTEKQRALKLIEKAKATTADQDEAGEQD